MTKKYFHLLLSVLAFVIVVPSEVFAAPPAGSVKLPAAKLRKMTGFYCGQVGSSWIPGKLVQRYFYSHQAEKKNVSKQLKTASKKAKKKLQGQIAAISGLIDSRSPLCVAGEANVPTPTPVPGNSGGGSAPAPTPTPGNDGGGSNPGVTPTPGPSALKFNFNGATALALADQAGSSAAFEFADDTAGAYSSLGKSNLRKVLPGGALQEVLESGEATISKFLVGPNNKLYVLFGSSCIDASCSQQCILGEVDTTTGDMNCVDKDLESISWDSSANNSAGSNKPLQFDGDGNLYYMGYANDGSRVLRKYIAASKTTEDLINQNISINGYLVMRDGSVLLAGYTSSSSTNWLRKRRINGGLVPVKSNFSVDWMSIFPDGRVYIGSGFNGIYRMRQDAEVLEAINWTGGDAYNSIYFDIYRAQMLHTANGSVYGLFGDSPNLTLASVFPVPHKITTSVNQINGITPILSDLLIYGSDSQGYGQLVLYDTATGDEQNLLGSEQLEVYRVQYLQSDNAVQFDAQRFSDGKYVMCTAYLGDIGSLACSPTGSVKLADFQSITTPGVRIPPAAVSPTPIALLEYDFAGAKALYGSDKVTSDGTLVPATLYSEGRNVPSFSADSNNTLWIKGAYFTDQDTVKCGLGRVSRTSGVPTCVFNSNEYVSLIKTRSDGSTFFVTEVNNSGSFTFTYKLYFSPVDGTASLIGSWLDKAPRRATITSSGSLLLAAYNYSGSFLRNYASDGQYTDLGVQVDYYGNFTTLSDGRILATGLSVPNTSSGIRTISADGSTVNAQRYSYYQYQWDPVYEGEVECSAGYQGCTGYQVSAFLNVGTRLFGIGSNTNWNDTALINYSPGPVSAISFSPAFAPNGITATSSDKIFMFGARNDVKKILSYDVVQNTEQDLTDDPALTVNAMQFIDGKLYILGQKPATNYQSYCDVYVGVKELNGGTSLTKSAKTVWCNGSTQDLIKF